MASKTTAAEKVAPKPGVEGTEKHNVDLPVKGVPGWWSSGGTLYSKVILFVSDAQDGSGKHFFMYNIADLTIAGRFFVHDLDVEQRLQAVKVGMWDPDMPVNVFAKVAKCEYKF